MNVDNLKADINHMLSKAKDEVLHLLEDDKNWEWRFIYDPKDGHISLRSSNNRYTVSLSKDDFLSIEISTSWCNHILIEEMPISKNIKWFKWFVKKSPVQSSYLVNRVREINQYLIKQRECERLNHKLKSLQEEFEK